MSRFGRLAVRTVFACALALSCLPVTATTASPVVVLAAFTGDPLPDDPIVGTIGPSSPDRKVYTIDLAPGDVIELQLNAQASQGDLDLHLYKPGATNPPQPGDAVAVSRSRSTYPETISFLVPPSGGGTYYVAVSVFQPLLQAMEYELSGDVHAPEVHRLASDDRYATSVAISRSTFATSTVAVLATGADYPDALAASALAGVLDAPLLLVRDSVDTDAFWDMITELERLGVSSAYLVGGTKVISLPVEAEIRKRVPDLERLEGTDRYETARKVADEVATIVAGKGGTVDAAFLVRGDGFADALAAGPYAFSQGMPVLLTRPGSLNSHAASFIETRDIVDVTVVGGEAAVSPVVAGAASSLNRGATIVERVDGDTRYETAANLADHAVGQGWATWGHVGVATGTNFPDALSGSAAMGRRGGVLLLTGPTALSSPAQSAIASNIDQVDLALVFGGPAVVYDAVIAQIEALFP